MNKNMEPVGVEPTSKHLPTYLSTTIGYVFFLTVPRHITQALVTASLSISYLTPRQGLIVSR